MKKSIKIGMLVLVMMLVILTSVSAATYCPNCSYDNVDGPYNTFTEVNYRDCFMPNSDCLMYDINCYHDYSCNDCFYNWGVYLFTLYNAHTVNHLG